MDIKDIFEHCIVPQKGFSGFNLNDFGMTFLMLHTVQSETDLLKELGIFIQYIQ